MCGLKRAIAKKCEIQGGSQEMAVMVGLCKIFNNDNSGEYLSL